MPENLRRFNLEEYKDNIAVGDIIRTNGDGDYIIDSDDHDNMVEGKVIRFDSDGFVLEHKDSGGGLREHCVAWVNEHDEVVVDVVKKFEPVAKAPLGVAKKKYKMWIKLYRENGVVVLDLRLPSQVEEYYKTISAGELQVSNKWVFADGSPVKFYKLSEEMKTLEQRVDGQTFSDYGNGLVDQDYINTAMVRTVGASGKKGVRVVSKHFNNTSDIDLKYFLDRFGQFLKTLFETSISKRRIQALITYEIQ